MGGGQTAVQQQQQGPGSIGLGAPVYSPFISNSFSNMKLNLKSEDAVAGLTAGTISNIFSTLANMTIADNNKDVAIEHTKAGAEVAKEYYGALTKASGDNLLIQREVNKTQRAAICSNERIMDKEAGLQRDLAKISANIQKQLARMDNNTKITCAKINAAKETFTSDFNRIDMALGLAKYSYGNTVK